MMCNCVCVCDRRNDRTQTDGVVYIRLSTVNLYVILLISEKKINIIIMYIIT